jgi:hypothetical protein
VQRVEDTRVEDAIRASQQPARSDQLLEAAVRYAMERHWDVCPGAWLEDRGGALHCSCGDLGCPEPGAHPTRTDWPGQATGSGPAVRRMWNKEPRASVLLPTGRGFDVIDVPEVAGCLALARMERMELPLGPVLCSPARRLMFFVLPGASVKVPDLLRRLGWPPSSLDLVVRGAGGYVAAPPTRVGGAGPVGWARQPTERNRWLPDVEELLSPLAYACGREAAAQRGRH